MKIFTIAFCLLLSMLAEAKEVALTFDDAPMASTKHFETHARTAELIKKLKQLNVPPVMIFAVACKREDSVSVVNQLKKHRDAGNFIANHTCDHPRLDDVGAVEYIKDIEKADKILSSLFVGQKYFRYPYLNEGKDVKSRDQVREWLKANNYRHGMVSIDDDDYLFSAKINQAKEKGKKIDYKKIESLFVDHLVGAANFYDDLAIKTLGRSPKHVILLHEMDATVMFVDSLVKALREDGWTIIGIEEAYQDKMYLEQPKNTDGNNGIVAQLYKEKTGESVGYRHYDEVKLQLNKILGL